MEGREIVVHEQNLSVGQATRTPRGTHNTLLLRGESTCGFQDCVGQFSSFLSFLWTPNYSFTFDFTMYVIDFLDKSRSCLAPFFLLCFLPHYQLPWGFRVSFDLIDLLDLWNRFFMLPQLVPAAIGPSSVSGSFPQPQPLPFCFWRPGRSHSLQQYFWDLMYLRDNLWNILCYLESHFSFYSHCPKS